MSAILLALLAAVGFSGASLLALLGGELRAKGRSYSAAVAVGISLAAVLLAARATRTRVVRTAALLGLAIPLAATLTMALPAPGEGTLGLLTGVAGGVLAYAGAAHLLPEAQAEQPSRVTAGLFAATLIITTVSLMTVLGD